MTAVILAAGASYLVAVAAATIGLGIVALASLTTHD